MSQELICSECGLDMEEQCQCYVTQILDLQTSIEDLMKIVARLDIEKKIA